MLVILEGEQMGEKLVDLVDLNLAGERQTEEQKKIQSPTKTIDISSKPPSELISNLQDSQ